MHINKYGFSSLFSIFLYFVFITQVSAIEYGGIGGRPAYPREDNPRSESIFIHEVYENEVISEGIKVINNTKETKVLMIYATDETPSTDGGFACEQLSEVVDEVGKWIKLEKEEVTLKPSSFEIVPFNISVPQFVDVGEHNGCIVIQEKLDKSDQAGLKLSFRTGIRVALTVPGDIVRLLEIIDFNVNEKNSDTFTITTSIKNSGNISLDSDIQVLVINVFSKETTRYGGEYSVLRNNPLVLNFDYQKPFWGGKFTAKTIVKFDDGNGEKFIESKTIDFISLPQKKALIYISALIAIIITPSILLIALRIKNKRKIKFWRNYVVKEGDTLNKIIKRYKLNWKEVIKVNKIKPPYELTNSQVIKIPPLRKTK